MSFLSKCCCCCFKKSSSKESYSLQQINTPSSTNPNSDHECFFVISTVFNPAGFKSRYELYNKFAQHMKSTGAQLITVECIFPELGQSSFHVTRPDNPYHIQLQSKSVYWMKENLINIAASKLPSHAKWICWLDGDIFFYNKNWIEQTISSLKKYAVVQVFEQADFLGPEQHERNVLRTDYSFGYSVVHNKIIDQSRYDEWYPHPGYGWAMSVEAFKAIGGLPDFDIVGSGDMHFAFSLINKVPNVIETGLNPQFKQMILQRLHKLYGTLVGYSKKNKLSVVGYVPGRIGHNWHGSRKDRQYNQRWKILIARDFNFTKDTVRLPNGLLQLSEKKPELQKDLFLYFKLRMEDGKVKGDADFNEQRSTDKGTKAKKAFRKKRTKMRGGKSSKGNNNEGFSFDGSFDIPDFPDPDSCQSDYSDGPDCGEGQNGNDSRGGRFDYSNDYNGRFETTTSY